MLSPATKSDEKAAWLHAFIILLVVSLAMAGLRLTGRQFLVFEFEISLIYFPTALAGIIAFYMTMKGVE